MKIVFISDTHDRYRDLTIPQCDVLVHAGDITHRGGVALLVDFLEWTRSQPAKRTVLIGGNHDRELQTLTLVQKHIDLLPWVHYLEDRAVKLFGLKFYGSPWQPEYKNMAFNLPRGSEELRLKWRKIPPDVDILITHGPPYGILDKIETERGGTHAGCKLLAERLTKVSAKIHVFGHIHEARGVHVEKHTTYINASVYYKGKVREPMVFEVNETGVSVLN